MPGDDPALFSSAVNAGAMHSFVGERFRQLRNVESPDDWIGFESDGDLLVFVMQHGGIIL